MLNQFGQDWVAFQCMTMLPLGWEFKLAQEVAAAEKAAQEVAAAAKWRKNWRRQLGVQRYELAQPARDQTKRCSRTQSMLAQKAKK
jgi:hypothetical protein